MELDKAQVYRFVCLFWRWTCACENMGKLVKSLACFDYTDDIMDKSVDGKEATAVLQEMEAASAFVELRLDEGGQEFGNLGADKGGNSRENVDQNI